MLPQTVSYNLSDHFESLEVLGIGTYSYVKHAIDKNSGDHVAIKICRRKTARDMLKNEYNILKGLDFTSVIKVYDFIDNDAKDESYLIMEYFEGKDLNKYIEESDGLEIATIKSISTQLITCVENLHAAGISHRDIKPENILVNEENEVKLIDFNISKVIKTGSDVGSKFRSVFYTQVSSPLYAAPELKNGVYSESVDIWGIGIIMFTLLFGNFKEHSQNILQDKSENKSQGLQSVIKEDCKLEDDCKALLLSLLSENVEERPSACECLASSWFR